MYASLRASGKKADLSLVVADEPAVAAGCFTKNVMCAAPVLYCKEVLDRKQKIKAVSKLDGNVMLFFMFMPCRFGNHNTGRSTRTTRCSVGYDDRVYVTWPAMKMHTAMSAVPRRAMLCCAVLRRC